MMQCILDWIRATRRMLSIPATSCLEVGSFNVNGSPRSVFPDAKFYWGIDLLEGAGVDQVGNAEVILGNLYMESFDTVICCETLEHTVHPWIVVHKMKSVLCSGGFLWISTPTYGFPLHRFPVDCYRFAEDAFRLWLFADMTLLAMETVTDELGQPAIVAVGQKWPTFPPSGRGVVDVAAAGVKDNQDPREG